MSPIVRIAATVSFLMLAYITLPPLFDLDVVDVGALTFFGAAVLVSFVAGLLTRSYWTIALLPPMAAFTLFAPLIFWSPQVSELLRGEYPVGRAIMQGFEILFAVVFCLLLAFYFLLTPPIAAGVWLGDKMLRR